MPKATPFSYTIGPANRSSAIDRYSSGDAAPALLLSGTGANTDLQVDYNGSVEQLCHYRYFAKCR